MDICVFYVFFLSLMFMNIHNQERVLKLYTHTRTHTQARTHAHTHTHTHTRTHSWMHAHAHTHTHAHILPRIPTYACTRTQTQAHTDTQTCARSRTPIHTPRPRTNTHTHTHIHTYTHTQLEILSCVWWFYCSWKSSHIIFLPSVCSAEQLTHACFRLRSTTDWSAGQIISHKTVFWEASPSTQKKGSFKANTDNGNKMRWTSTFPYFNHHEGWAAVITSLIAISLTLRQRRPHTCRETIGLRHYHFSYRYHYVPQSS